MSDNRRVYRTIRRAIQQLYPQKLTGQGVRMLTTLAALVSWIVQGKSCQLPTVARKAPDQAMVASRVKRYTRWIQNERVDYEGYYLPFVQQLLGHLTHIRELVFVIDGNEVGHACITLMISLIYGHRAISITWLVVKGRKGHLPESLHLELLSQLQAILPQNAQAIFLGDGKFDGIELQMTLQALNMRYICRTAKNTQLFEDDHVFSFAELCLSPGNMLNIPNVWFTREGYGPVTVIARWQLGYTDPLFLVTNFDLPNEAIYGYHKRFQIETFFRMRKATGSTWIKVISTTPNDSAP